MNPDEPTPTSLSSLKVKYHDLEDECIQIHEDIFFTPRFSVFKMHFIVHTIIDKEQ